MKNNSTLTQDLLRVLMQGKSTKRFLVGSILSFAFSITVILCTIGLMDGFEDILRRSLRKSSGDITITNEKGFFPFNQKLQQTLQLKKITSMTPLIQSEGFLIFDGKSKGVLLKGVTLNSFNEVTGLDLNVFQGEVAIGKALAQELRLKVSDEVVLALGKGNLSFSDLPILVRFKVGQIISHGIYEKDLRFLYVNKEQLASILQGDSSVNQILLNVPKESDIANLARELNQELPVEFRVKPYWSEFKTLLEAVKVEKYSIGLVLQLIVVVSIFNILAFVIYLNERRTQEIFLLKALGMSAKTIGRLWVFTVVFIWAGACVCAIFLTGLFDLMLRNLEVLKLPGEIYVLSELSLSLNLQSYALVFLLSLIWVLLIAGITILRVQKRSIVTELKKGFV